MLIKPFKAFRFNPTVVGDVGNCIAPPYDVISEAAQHQLLEKSKYNIVRVTKGTEKASDTQKDNQYTRAAGFLEQWIELGALRQDKDEAIYAYVQDFRVSSFVTRDSNLRATSDERQVMRYSFIALGKLEEFGEVVKPHEQILEKPMADRLNLKKATLADLGLVFMLYEDNQKIADRIISSLVVRDSSLGDSSHESRDTSHPLIDFVDEQDVRHQLFNISDKKEIEQIVSMMKDKSCIIADGHHRYTTGLKFAKESGMPEAQYQMIGFANTNQDGLIVLATHRVVENLKNFSLQKVIEGLKKRFQVTEYLYTDNKAKSLAKKKMLEHMRAEHKENKSAFGIYGGNNAFYVAVLKDKDAINKAAPQMSPAWRTLDLAILHKLILEELLGIDQNLLAKGGNLQYVKDTPNAIDDTIDDIDSGDKQAAFFTNAVTINQLKMVTDAGERMPQKATYFYPKLYSGLTIHKL